jgi:hypothetical protein
MILIGCYLYQHVFLFSNVQRKNEERHIDNQNIYYCFYLVNKHEYHVFISNRYNKFNLLNGTSVDSLEDLL